MPIELTRSKDRLVRYVRWHEAIMPLDLQQFGEQILREAGEAPPLTYVEMGAVSECDFGFDTIRDHARSVQTYALRQPRRLMEIIYAPEDLTFGVARMFQTLVEGGVDVRIFRSETDAKAALRFARDRLSETGQTEPLG